MTSAADTPLRWGDKPYHSLDWELRSRFGEKIGKLSLNGGMTCPNRDGRLGSRGCLFCSEGGSGDFAADASLSIREQILCQQRLLAGKRPCRRYIAYFQAYTNTYAPVDRLRELFTEAIRQPDVEILSIATRPDCLPPPVLDLLAELAEQKPVWVELGLQTIHPDTARFIRRGYELPVFDEAVSALRKRGIEVIVHTILGLPGEGPERVFETIAYLNGMDIQGVKLQLLHVLKHTDLGRLYRQEPFPLLSQQAYTDLVIGCLERLRPRITIHRLTGDGPRNLLLGPAWSLNKRSVLNGIHAQMRRAGSWQGRLC